MNDGTRLASHGFGRLGVDVAWLRASRSHFSQSLRQLFERVVNRRSALPIGMGLALVAGVGDALTTAAATFTLIYVFPIWIVVWYRSQRAAYVVVAQVVLTCTVVSLKVDVPRPTQFLVWNDVVDLGLYWLFVHAFGALRAHLDEEAERRQEAVGQLRHADRLNTLGKLAAGVAHELGTPMNVIAGRASLIADGTSQGQLARRSGTVIVEQVDRMIVIIRHLLDFARRGGTRKQSVDVNALARGVVALLEPLAKKAGVELVVHGESLIAELNSSEIQQVVSNLVTNGIQAMPGGGRMEIEVRSELSRPPKSSAPERPFALIAVCDNGSGIGRDVLPHIFDPFFTTKDVGEGTGLGLSVSYGIVSDHGGFMRVSTRLGTGSRFAVYLPL